jgi:4-amino-4-deoxy-L-arabinose transferase-like glycosyltransferase
MDVKMNKIEATAWFWSVVLAFAGLWILLPYLFHTGYKPDVIELQFVGKEWVLADRKHPMLPAWILELINIFTGRSFVAPFIAQALCTVITLFAVWRLARQVLSERLALIGTFSMLPFWSITVESIQFNQNSALMACWTLTILMFYNAFQTNKKRWWIAAGITLGLGLHAKYTMILIALAILFYSLCYARFRRYWKEAGPWLTVAVAFVVFLPHLIWLHYAGFWTTTGYAVGRQVHYPGIVAHFYAPAKWIVCQISLLILSPLLLLIPCLGTKWRIFSPQSDVEKETLQYLLCCMAFPFLLITLFATTGANAITAYGYTLWFFLGVYLLLRFQRQDSAATFRRTLCWTSLAVFAMVIAFIVQAVASPYLSGTVRRFHFPMRELGTECDRIWDRFSDSPCAYTTGEWVYAGNAAYAMKCRPSVHFYYGGIEIPDAMPTGTWSTDDDVNRKGGLIFWDASEQGVPDWVHRRFPQAEVLPEILVLPYKTGAKISPERIGMAVVLPPV